MLSKEETQHIAKLARLGLSESEIEKYQKDLSAILDYVDKLKEADVGGIDALAHRRPRDDLDARSGVLVRFGASPVSRRRLDARGAHKGQRKILSAWPTWLRASLRFLD